MASSAQQDDWIKRLMECPVCLGKVKNHRALPCQHIFCQDCLVPLITDGRLSCPTCRDDRKLDPGGVDSLPRSVLLMQALERFCVQCMDGKREILCTHCDRWLCATCHDACSKIESLLAETTRLLSRHSDRLLQIKVTRAQLEKNQSAVSSQVTRHAREIIDAFTAAVGTREKKLQNEIRTETQKQLTKLDALSRDISDQMEELRSFTAQAEPDKLESTDISELSDTWTKSVRDDVITDTVPNCYFSFTPGDKMSVDSIPAIGKLQISTSVKDATDTTCPTASGKQGVRRVNYATGRLSHTVFGSQGSGPGELECPSHVAISPVSGNIVVTDKGNHRVQIYNSNRQFVSQFGSKGSQQGQFDFSSYYTAGGVAVTSQGVIAVCDTDNHRLQLLTERGEHLRDLGSQGSQPGCFRHPLGMCCHRDQLYVCDFDNRRVQVLALDGTVVRVIGTRDRPRDVAVCAGGELVVAHGGVFGDGQLRVYSADGAHKATLGRGEPGSVRLEWPGGVTVTSEGHIIVTDVRTHQVHVLEQSGKLIRTFGSRGDKPGQLLYPLGVVCTQDGGVVVVDQDNHRIQIFRFE